MISGTSTNQKLLQKLKKLPFSGICKYTPTKANKRDIIIKDKQEKTCMLIDMAILSDRNTSVKVAEKLSKYKVLKLRNVGIENNNSACCHRGTWSSQERHRKTH